jgi:uncharacterized protein YutD
LLKTIQLDIIKKHVMDKVEIMRIWEDLLLRCDYIEGDLHANMLKVLEYLYEQKESLLLEMVKTVFFYEI